MRIGVFIVPVDSARDEWVGSCLQILVCPVQYPGVIGRMNYSSDPEFPAR